MSAVLISIWCGYTVVMTSIDEYVEFKIVEEDLPLEEDEDEEEENSYT
jgi:hypothetical protein